MKFKKKNLIIIRFYKFKLEKKILFVIKFKRKEKLTKKKKKKIYFAHNLHIFKN